MKNAKDEKLVNDLKDTLAKFTNDRDNLNVLLGNQRGVYDKGGLDTNQKNLRNHSRNYLHQQEHQLAYLLDAFLVLKKVILHLLVNCNMRKIVNFGDKKVWVPKATLAATNTKGLKKI